MKRKIMMYAVIASIALHISSCKKNKGEENEEEVLTTLSLTCTPVGGGSPITFTYDDPDGPGGYPPQKQTILLLPNKTYNVSLQVLNKTTTPITDVTPEIIAEGASHRFYYSQPVGNFITFTNLNKDANNISLGTTSTWTTGASGTGKVLVTLRHYPGNPPNKAEADAANNSKSSTDLEVEFDASVN